MEMRSKKPEVRRQKKNTRGFGMWGLGFGKSRINETGGR